MQSKSSIESSHRISKPRKNPNLNLNNLVIGFCHQSCAFWRISLNSYLLLLLGTSKSRFDKREGKDGLLMHASILAVFSLFVLPLSFFLSVLFLLLVSYYSHVMGCSSFWSFLFWVLLSGCLQPSYHGFPPILSASPIGSSSFGVFFLSSVFFPLLPFSDMITSLL